MGTACLLYGIVFAESGEHARGHSPPGLPPGVCGAPVRLIDEGVLGAAISWIEPSDLTPNFARALSYAKVVEALHADRVVLPMRYGCLFGQEDQVVELLRVHGEEYAALLRGLDGCVEMGVRVLVERAEGRARVAEVPSHPPGRSYLAGRTAVYAEKDRRAHEEGRVVERCREAFAGLFVKFRAEYSSARAPDVALYFLVKRGAVDSFRQAFGRISRAESARLLLSGPWPAYNFAAPERQGNGHG